jgi:hypothetical protein
MRLCKFVLAVNLLCLPLLGLAANEYSLKHIEQTPTLDGHLSEEFWQRATLVEAKYETNPREGAPAVVKTIAYVYEDGNSLHLGLRAWDPDPSKIRAHLVERDTAWSDDLLGFSVDTFNDQRSAYEFYVNPKGVQIDVRIRENNGRDDDDAWNAIWYGAATILEDGWSAEISVPFNALRFPEAKGEQTWGFAIFRKFPRDVSRWSTDLKRDPSDRCHLCQLNKITGFQNITPGKNFQISPTLTFSENEFKETLPGEWQSEGGSAEAGLDLRWGLTQNSVLNLTLNPDFSQVEADAAQLDINRAFSLFLPERRPFFLDGADTFETNSFQFVHTRNVANPDYGLKLTGKSSRHTYGVMIANDESTAFLLPGNSSSTVVSLNDNYESDSASDSPVKSDVLVARYKSDFKGNSHIGALLTHRQANGYENTLLSFDNDLRLSDVSLIRTQLAFSESQNPLQLQTDYNLEEKQQDHAISIDLIRNTGSYRVQGSYQDVGTDFRADMGFIVESNYRRYTLEGQLKYYGELDDFFSKHFLNAEAIFMEDQDGNRIFEEYEIEGDFRGPMQSKTKIEIENGYRFHQNQYNPEGEFFNENKLDIEFEFTPIGGLTYVFELDIGNSIDFSNAQLGKNLKLETELDWKIGEHLNLVLAHNYSALDVDATSFDGVDFDKGQLFEANQSDLRLYYQFSVQSQLKLVVQYTDIQRNPNLYRANFDDDPDTRVFAEDKNLSTQLLYSYKLNPQSLFYIGYSDGAIQINEMDSLEKNQRSVFAKISYAWQR